MKDHVDLNLSNGISDYRRGLKTREGHKDTDFGMLSVQQMMRGIDVLVATAGKVSAIRDEVTDRPVIDPNRSSLAGKECGNAVALRH